MFLIQLHIFFFVKYRSEVVGGRRFNGLEERKKRFWEKKSEFTRWA